MKKKTVTQLKKKLWEECRRISIEKYGNVCFTCGAYCEGSGRHLGHFIPSSTCGAFLRYDLRNLRIQCYRCNINGGGQGAEFYKRLVETEGQEYVDQLFKDKNVSIKADVWWYEEMINKYKQL
jgi:hypothetical protein